MHGLGWLFAVVLLFLAGGCATTQSRLMQAAMAGNTTAVNALLAQFLLDHGADANAKTIDGKTALMLIRESGTVNVEEIARILEGAGAND